MHNKVPRSVFLSRTKNGKMSESKCAQCGEGTLIKCDRNVVEGSGKLNPKIELLSLELPFHFPFCKYICRNCVDILKREKEEIERRPREEVNKQIHEKHRKAVALNIRPELKSSFFPCLRAYLC